MEPLQKKRKLETIDIYINELKQCTNLKAVLDEDYDKPLPLINVYVGQVKDPKQLSKVKEVLNEKLPLKELSHLKRIRKRDVLLCPSSHLNGCSSIQEFILTNVQELSDIFTYFKEIAVPATAPKLKKQISQAWSFNFHPNKYLEQLTSSNVFTKDVLKHHITFMEIAFEAVRFHMKTSGDDLLQTNATVVVDSSCNFIVAVAIQNDDHPIQHSTMLAIDNVAKTQNGGAWGETCQEITNCTFKGIEPNLLEHLKLVFPKNCFGARLTGTSYGGSDSQDSKKQDSPYLCTGYYIYTLKEPCLMCSMALVHARAKRVFFCFDNEQNGALKSRMKLQAVSALNHHFEVFTGFL